MIKIEEKLKTLSLIAKKLNRLNVLWAVGGSTLLYLKGLISNFDDLDIEVNEADILIVKEALLDIGILKESEQTNTFKTKHFLEFNINNVDVDIMAGLVIVVNNEEHYFPLNKNITDYILIDEERVPLQSLNKWLKYYQLMNRVDKVKIIKESLKER